MVCGGGAPLVTMEKLTWPAISSKNAAPAALTTFRSRNHGKADLAGHIVEECRARRPDDQAHGHCQGRSPGGILGEYDLSTVGARSQRNRGIHADHPDCGCDINTAGG